MIRFFSFGVTVDTSAFFLPVTSSISRTRLPRGSVERRPELVAEVGREVAEVGRDAAADVGREPARLPRERAVDGPYLGMGEREGG